MFRLVVDFSLDLSNYKNYHRTAEGEKVFFWGSGASPILDVEHQTDN